MKWENWIWKFNLKVTDYGGKSSFSGAVRTKLGCKRIKHQGQIKSKQHR